MKTFRVIGVLVGSLYVTGDTFAGTAGFGANAGVYNPYAGYSVGNQAAFVGENLGLQAGVVGLNALAQKAYEWGNSFNKKRKRNPQGEFGLFPHSYVQQGTLTKYRKVVGTVREVAISPDLAAAANLTPEFVEQNKRIDQLCAKWRQEDPEAFLAELKVEEQYAALYPTLEQEAAELVKHRQRIQVLLQNPHDPAVEEQLRHISHEAYVAASKIDLIILKMVTQEVETNKEAIIKGFSPGGGGQQQGSRNLAASNEDREDDKDGPPSPSAKRQRDSHQVAQNSLFDKNWLEERQIYLEDAVLIWYHRFREQKPNGDLYERPWDRTDLFLKEGHNAWLEAIETEKFIKSQLDRY
jgi:hypothetical protein